MVVTAKYSLVGQLPFLWQCYAVPLVYMFLCAFEMTFKYTPCPCKIYVFPPLIRFGKAPLPMNTTAAWPTVIEVCYKNEGIRLKGWAVVERADGRLGEARTFGLYLELSR